MSDRKNKTQDNQKTEQPGEGNRKAAQRYNKETRAFVDSERGKKAISDHPIKSTAEGQESDRAEQKARDRAKETDPQVTRDYHKPSD